MTQTSVKILADSLSPQSHRLTTFVLKLPRIILAELNTHRMFSRNSSSSRAESITKKLERVKNEMFIPDRFAKNCKGMSNKEWLDNTEKMWQRPVIGVDGVCHSEELITRQEAAEDEWKIMATYALSATATLGNSLDVHKQHANRLLEPFEYITVIVTASEWDGFWEQRCPKYVWEDFKTGEKTYFKSKNAMFAVHPDSNMDYATQEEWDRCQVNTAQPEMMELAEMMYDEYMSHKPTQLKAGEWHVPFGDNITDEKILAYMKRRQDKRDSEDKGLLAGECCRDFGGFFFNTLEERIVKTRIKIATARCARVSYLTHEGKEDYEADIRLYDFLIEYMHMSPNEHCCVAMTDAEYFSFIKGKIDINDIPNDDDIRKGRVDWAAYRPNKVFGWCNNIRGFIQHRWEIENG
mgnify:CR=1 FL=1